MTDDENDARTRLPSLRGERSPVSPTRAARRIRKVSPLGFRVVVRLEKDANMTETGLYLPEGARESTMESLLAEVIEVASATDVATDEETNVSGVPLGAKVLIPKSAGVKLPWDDECRIVETREILAIVDEIVLS